MEKKCSLRIISLYLMGNSIRKISMIVCYSKEAIRKELHKNNITMRKFCGYPALVDFNNEKLCLFYELFGYLYGDGSLHRRKDDNRFELTLYFSLDEKDLVERVAQITYALFSFCPIIKPDQSGYNIIFRKSFGRYLFTLNYPVGKKSIINPQFPSSITQKEDSYAFIR
ncbi:hypothetical protein HZB00_00205 [Candidatus Woesearchaeota archaeon]|nr:hypothetical protein [Candidatus Woesearchaeota archaeon]